MELIAQVFPAFLLVFCRITAFFVTSPIFSNRMFTARFRVGIAFFVSILVFLTIGYDTSIVADGYFILAIIRETLIGMLIGFIAYLFFAIVQTAGGLIDLHMGLAMANVVDPVSGVTAPIMGNLKFMLMSIVFLTLNGHHYLLSAIMRSYEWVPLDNHFFQKIYNGSTTAFLARTFADTFLLALQIAAPIMVAMFIADVGLAMLTRAAPQFNVFVVGIPIKIMVGLALLIVLMLGMGVLFQMLFNEMFAALEKLFVLLRTP